ncbi:helix-turn-helix transcriptional regulator [Streptomyces griseus]|uniref:Helix-turn-helix transcriptional regulator n=1 Tax=Streptomyces stephensoniae TaxID=3375367 RepID=A0ABU2WBM2_9ACTN|nr:helix-turn-helix transcriptional regulator [Streptomyces griseus]MDT0495270.1 helix-turn-helix transcriptional regulator [Streptomyces griseus]
MSSRTDTDTGTDTGFGPAEAGGRHATTGARRTEAGTHPAQARPTGPHPTDPLPTGAHATAARTGEAITTSALHAAATGADAFPGVLREALNRRGLSLERVSERLRGRGIAISQATLSSWQRGRSQPERARSLRAVEVLEEILELPAGALRSLLGPRRPRGRTTPAGDEGAALQILGEDSVVEKALGARFRHFNQETSSLVVHDVVTIGESGTLSGISTTNVLRAGQAGADRVIFVLSFDDEAAEPVDIRVTCGRLVEATYLKRLKSLVLEIHFGRELAKLDTTVVSYAVDVSPSETPATHYERWSRTNLHEYLQQVFFHPGALPSDCHRYVREKVGAPPRAQRRIPLSDTHNVHVLTSRCKPGVHGVAWEYGQGTGGTARADGTGGTGGTGGTDGTGDRPG